MRRLAQYVLMVLFCLPNSSMVLFSIIDICFQIFRIPFTAMNINPEVWGEDAHIFRPERWIVPGGIPPPGELPHGWSGLATFCDGPRSCLGWRLGKFAC